MREATGNTIISCLGLALGVAAAAILSAPPAAASSNPVTCRDGGAARVCHKQGHSSLHARPEIRQPAGGLFHPAWLPGYGRGHLPPILALD